ncbi:MAG: vitamin K epoxide reductase family protein [Actinobacteria bacterium]|nr:vitamin K epoxide reductase family protein [Actinomycetota bacterium]MCL5883569.1 vitamin K epoxide reductase family protein [Actinomycetota bacterium]
MKAILTIIIILTLAGIIDSGYALQRHYSTAESSSCDFNATVSCTAVNQSQFSEVAGIPVAGLGVAGYMVMGAVAGLMLAGKGPQGIMGQGLVMLALVALAISLALTYIEVFVLGAVCPLCVISLLIVTAITVLAIVAAVSRGRTIKVATRA